MPVKRGQVNGQPEVVPRAQRIDSGAGIEQGLHSPCVSTDHADLVQRQESLRREDIWISSASQEGANDRLRDEARRHTDRHRQGKDAFKVRLVRVCAVLQKLLDSRFGSRSAGISDWGCT